MQEYFPNITNIIWSNLLAYLGTNENEVPMPHIKNTGTQVREQFDSNSYTVCLDCENEFNYASGLIYEGEHAVQFTLSNGEYGHSSPTSQFEKNLELSLKDPHNLIDFFKCLAFQEGMAYGVEVPLLQKYLEMTNYRLVFKKRTGKIIEGNKEDYARNFVEGMLVLGTDTGMGPNLLTTMRELLTLNSFASIVGYCCVSKLNTGSVKKLIRQKNAHCSPLLQFNSSYDNEITIKIGSMVRKYLQRGTYFEGIVLDVLTPIVPGIVKF